MVNVKVSCVISKYSCGHNDAWFGDGFKTAVKVFGEDVMYLGKYGPCTMIKNDWRR